MARNIIQLSTFVATLILISTILLPKTGMSRFVFPFLSFKTSKFENSVGSFSSKMLIEL